MRSKPKKRPSSTLDRLKFLLESIECIGRIDQAGKVIYLDFDVQMSPVHVHDIGELKADYKFRVQYEIPCE